ncbi:MAG: hypothetical protein HC923_03195 [Myxococcales bacterium]|nr:hypothetical protein [Myxococcales bacterium]
MSALDRVRAHGQGLDDALIHQGLFDSRTLLELRLEAERRTRWMTRPPPSSLDALMDASDPGGERRDPDTLFDISAGPRMGGAAAEANHPESELFPSLDEDDPEDDLGPTKPYLAALPPSLQSASGSLGDAPWPSPLREATHLEEPTNGVDVEVAQRSATLSPNGRTTTERYQLLGELGRGGMGRILKARDAEIGREVALKILLPANDASELHIRRFWTEVQATGQLEHPSIIPIHDVGRMPTGELFYVMKKLTGRTLANILGALRRADLASREEFTRVRLLTIFQQHRVREGRRVRARCHPSRHQAREHHGRTIR